MQLVIFETHPIQYRVPIYQELNRIRPDQFMVVFASDFSVRGYRDHGFSEDVAWDLPLLQGYPFEVLGNDRSGGIECFRGLSRHGVTHALRTHKPKAIMLSSFQYEFCQAAFWYAWFSSCKIWLRMETSDVALHRTIVKKGLRQRIYRFLYRRADRFFVIGANNRDHYLRHGVESKKLRDAFYATANPISGLSNEQKMEIRAEMRERLQIDERTKVFGFFGKLIDKKYPSIILEAWSRLAEHERNRIHLLFVGSGQQMESLQMNARGLAASATFAGFINQSELMKYYLATDTVILPSRKLGETWGLVVNEALQAGCSAIVSSSVGCGADFKVLERFDVFPSEDASALADAMRKHLPYERLFDWCNECLKPYSIEQVAQAIAREMDALG